MTSGGSLQPAHPSTGFDAAELTSWDRDGAIASSEAYRHALWFETGGIPQGEPVERFVAMAPPRPQPTAGARGRRALLLVAAGVAGVASGALVSGHGGLPGWRPLLDEARVMAASLMPGASERTSLASATLTSTAQAETVAIVPRATPSSYVPARIAAVEPAGAPPAAARQPADALFETELVQGVVLAAALSEAPVWQDAALPAPPEPAVTPAQPVAPPQVSAMPAPAAEPVVEAAVIPVVEPMTLPAGELQALVVEAAAPMVVELPPAPVVEPAAPGYRVQLATLRYRRNAMPVWEKFVSRFGPPGDLERYVTTAETSHGQRYLVQVGPFADAPHAAALCDRILQKGGDCVVVPPAS